MRVIRIAAALALAACTANVPPASPSASTRAEVATASTATAASTPTATASATPGRLNLDDRYGWIAPSSPAINGFDVRSETASTSLVRMSGDYPVVSEDGRSIAYWSPAGNRHELHVVSPRTRVDRVVVTLPADEFGQAVGWATDGSGLAFQADSSIIPGGGVDPPPAFSAIRTVDLGTGRITEVLRRERTRLVPFGWSRARHLIAAYVSAGAEGGPTSYLLVNENGTAQETSLGSDSCVHSIGLRLDGSGSTVLSIHPIRCSNGSGTLSGTSAVRAWAIDDPTTVRVIDLGAVFLLDAVFRPRTTDIVTTSISGETLAVDVWSGGARRRLVSADAKNVTGTQFVPVIFRPNESVALVHYPTSVAVGATTWSSRLIEVISGAAADVDIPGGSPIASVLLAD
jgi:hypothetical protein